MEKDERELLRFANEMVSLTIRLGKQHGQELTKQDAFDIAQNIVASNYPKCAVKYITGQAWML